MCKSAYDAQERKCRKDKEKKKRKAEKKANLDKARVVQGRVKNTSELMGTKRCAGCDIPYQYYKDKGCTLAFKKVGVEMKQVCEVCIADGRHKWPCGIF